MEPVSNRSNIRPEHGRYRVYVIGSRACIDANRRLCWVCSFIGHDKILRVTTKSNQRHHRPLIGTKDVRKLFLDEKNSFFHVRLIRTVITRGQYCVNLNGSTLFRRCLKYLFCTKLKWTFVPTNWPISEYEAPTGASLNRNTTLASSIFRPSGVSAAHKPGNTFLKFPRTPNKYKASSSPPLPFL